MGNIMDSVIFNYCLSKDTSIQKISCIGHLENLRVTTNVYKNLIERVGLKRVLTK